MQKRELLYFEWAIIDRCDLQCEYCIDKGVYAQKPVGTELYRPGVEVDVAKKLVTLAAFASTLKVNICAGEPLLARHIREVVEILSGCPNIRIEITTNLNHMTKLAPLLAKSAPDTQIVGSIHIAQRSQKWIDNLITFLQEYRHVLRIRLSQVDYNLTYENRKTLGRIMKETGMDICFVTYIPPRPPATQEVQHDGVPQHFQPALHKRCCIGFSHFLLKPNGFLGHGLWCTEEKTADFLAMTPMELEKCIPNEMHICPHAQCGCNYNIFNYEEYITACRRLGYTDSEIFLRSNPTRREKLKRWFSNFRSRRLGF